MIARQHIENTRSQAKGLLVVVLLLSLFSFPGSSFYQNQQRQISKTEQVASVNRSVRRTCSYKSSLISLQRKNSSQLNATDFAVAALQHTQLIELRQLVMTEETLSFNQPTEHFRSACIPLSSDEESFNSLRG